MSKSGWLVVLRPDGVIVEVSGGAPTEWVGTSVGEGNALPDGLRSAAGDLLAQARRAKPETWFFRATMPGDGAKLPPTEILVVEAVPLRRTATPLNELLTRTTEALMEQARATLVTLKIAADDGMPDELYIDGEKIAWGVAALVGSALRHVSNAPGQEKLVSVEARYDDRARAVVISVTDNGPGIPASKLRALVTRDPDTQRTTGLALLLLHDLVAAHGGRMEIQSSTEAKGHGTRVTLHLPGV
jgi:signal transduction histidine kinase